jgi:carbohydrate diacid regulator
MLMLERLDDEIDSIESNARMIKDMINAELYTQVYIGIGNTCLGLMNIKDSMEQGWEAIKVGRMFNLPDDIFMFRDILPERIISLIPEEKCEELAGRILSDETNHVLDGEMIRTVEVFFKNNLNISDSARILYIHRNTLLYRLDKLQKATGLDVRKFEDAVTFKLAHLLKLR